MPIALLTPLSLASIEPRLTGDKAERQPDDVDEQDQPGQGVALRSFTAPHTVPTPPGTTLLQPRAAMVLMPNPFLRR